MPKARVFTDLHESAARPTLDGNDIFLDDGSGSLNSNLSGLTGWSGIPTNIRQGYNSRTCFTDGEWILESSPTTDIVFGVDLINKSTGYAVGNVGIILKLVDGLWSSDTSPTTDLLENVSLADANNGYAVGASGRIVKLSGGTWSNDTSPTSNNLRDVAIVDANNGWAVGDSGTILQLSSGSWSTISSPTTDALTGLSLIDINNGYAVGASGRIVKLSGGTWSNDTSPTTDLLRNVSLADANNGWAVGNGGRIIELSSGSWSLSTSPTTNTLQSIDIIDASTGYAVGASGTILQLSSGSWSTISSPTTDTIFNIKLIDNSSGYSVGVGGNLIRLFTGCNIGTDNSRRIAWFYVDYDGSSYSADFYDGSSFNYIVTELLNAEDQTGTQKWIKWYPFTDSNGYPTSINYDLGGGAQDYCAWGVEYQNENTNGYLQNQKLVLIRDFTYPASPDDTVTATVDDLLTLTSVNVDQGEYSVVRIIKGSSIVQNAVYNADLANNKPNYDSLITVEETALTTDVTNTILSNHWCEGGILGEGGSGSTDGAGAIDNIRFLTL
jgi:hypothetical protein